jgi:4-hydroxybenzoate polyprenyltransferase
MRPRQWTKNVLFVFPALVFDGQLFVLDSFLRVAAACVLLIFMSSTVYIINDLVDIEKDRLHPRKKNRALPSGQLPKQLAIIAACIIPVITLLLPETRCYSGRADGDIGVCAARAGRGDCYYSGKFLALVVRR